MYLNKFGSFSSVLNSFGLTITLDVFKCQLRWMGNWSRKSLTITLDVFKLTFAQLERENDSV